MIYLFFVRASHPHKKNPTYPHVQYLHVPLGDSSFLQVKTCQHSCLRPQGQVTVARAAGAARASGVSSAFGALPKGYEYGLLNRRFQG